MSSTDQWVRDNKNVQLASFGPRKLVGNSKQSHVEPCSPGEAQFWGVYRCDDQGHPVCVGDAHDGDSARELATWVGKGSIDPLTIAYIAKGAGTYMARLMSYIGSELDVIAEVLEWAAAVDFASHGVELTACFAYEVAEPFGRWAAARVVTMGTIDPDHALEHIGALVQSASR
ncbi:hypothetical protein RHOFW510R12_00755 [Rhodanobacter sp. FW510-R12]|uniref:hypothetical protein n=1 Tax=Rhodanobacter thiooxydans TaxID=416169 RepID=UPI00091A9427|nr:hypothetical protein [Rhodanobacter thiooxydans]UJJ56770.1 hypothetical protein LRK53_18315 [Rhodanobacter thiooxydans]